MGKVRNLSLHGGENLDALDGVDAEVGFHIHVHVDHLGRIAGLLGDDGEQRRREGGERRACSRGLCGLDGCGHGSLRDGSGSGCRLHVNRCGDGSGRRIHGSGRGVDRSGRGKGRRGVRLGKGRGLRCRCACHDANLRIGRFDGAEEGHVALGHETLKLHLRGDRRRLEALERVHEARGRSGRHGRVRAF